MNETKQSLMELADSIDLLAEQIKTMDALEATNEFMELHKEFEEITENYSLERKETWSKKYRKGYLKEWLRDRGLEPAQATEGLSSDRYLTKTAEYLADNFSKLEEFYKSLKNGQSVRRNFNFLDHGNAMAYISTWCQMLKNHEIIDYVIEKQNGFYVDIAEMKLATFFINGYWLELLLRSEIGDLIKNNGDKIDSFDILSGVEILKPDNSLTEFDLMLMVNEQVYWFECKSGDIGRYYKLFNEHRKLIDLDYKNAVAVIPSPNVQIASNFRKRSQMQTFSATDLQAQLNRILFKDQTQLI